MPVYLLTCISLFISARCHSPASGEWGGRSHVNQSVASWRHRSVLLSPIRARRQVWATKPLTLSTLPAPRLHFFFFSTPMQPGKQLPAIQITCQSDGVMKARLAFQISRRAFKCRCSFGASAFLFLFPFLYV